MNELILFIDGSLDVRSKIGYGAYLAVTDPAILPEAAKTQVKVKRFEPTSSTTLELQTLLWALGSVQAAGQKIIVHTDSQNIIGLPGRRARFEQSNYYSTKNRRLKNWRLYQEFFRITDALECECVQLRGHLRAHEKDNLDKLFTLVDRASRQALRGERW